MSTLPKPRHPSSSAYELGRRAGDSSLHTRQRQLLAEAGSKKKAIGALHCKASWHAARYMLETLIVVQKKKGPLENAQISRESSAFCFEDTTSVEKRVHGFLPVSSFLLLTRQFLPWHISYLPSVWYSSTSVHGDLPCCLPARFVCVLEKSLLRWSLVVCDISFCIYMLKWIYSWYLHFLTMCLTSFIFIYQIW